MAEIKPIFNIPVAIGFGIKNESHVKALANKVQILLSFAQHLSILFLIRG